MFDVASVKLELYVSLSRYMMHDFDSWHRLKGCSEKNVQIQDTEPQDGEELYWLIGLNTRHWGRAGRVNLVIQAKDRTDWGLMKEQGKGRTRAWKTGRNMELNYSWLKKNKGEHDYLYTLTDWGMTTRRGNEIQVNTNRSGEVQRSKTSTGRLTLTVKQDVITRKILGKRVCRFSLIPVMMV